MTKTKLYVPDIECDSCVRLIEKKLYAKPGINDVITDNESVEIDYDNDKTSDEELVSIIARLGFRASIDPFERKTFGERLRDFKENKKKYALEIKGFNMAIFTFLILCALEALAYIGLLKNIPDFFSHYAIWLLYLNISIVILGYGVWHIYSYKAKMTCMVGMMIGMTLGMQTGLLIGAVIGATNGFFTGAMVGMMLGVIIGIIAGRQVGIMGVMEGMMAGVMGGTMGAMISVMMFTDRILIFMPFYLIINIIIVLGMSYMLFEEVVENKKGITRKPVDEITFAALCLIFAFILIIIMIYGPKSGLFIF